MALINALLVGPIVALIFGVLILVYPRLLNYLIGMYLVIIGLLGIIMVFL